MAKAKRKRQFPCGYKGRGQVCKRCLQANQLLEQAKTTPPLDVLVLHKEALRLRANHDGVLPAHFEELGYDHDTAFYLAHQMGIDRKQSKS